MKLNVQGLHSSYVKCSMVHWRLQNTQLQENSDEMVNGNDYDLHNKWYINYGLIATIDCVFLTKDFSD